MFHETLFTFYSHLSNVIHEQNVASSLCLLVMTQFRISTSIPYRNHILQNIAILISISIFF